MCTRWKLIQKRQHRHARVKMNSALGSDTSDKLGREIQINTARYGEISKIFTSLTTLQWTEIFGKHKNNLTGR